MGIWNAKDADFVCIEPWCGIADHVNASGVISEKEGINKLQPEHVFNRIWTVDLFKNFLNQVILDRVFMLLQ